jgi:hypothetical protein
VARPAFRDTKYAGALRGRLQRHPEVRLLKN